jgi:dTDP-4-dehydrorhamnose 3,5-epimerase
MKFIPTPIQGAFLVDIEPRGDERGMFARTFCEREFGAMGLETHFAQANASFSRDRGTLRGMHYQLADAAEAKLVRCVRGALWDVVLDLRTGSPSFGQWFGEDLTQENRRAMYVPKGVAHGFITLEDASEAAYMASAFYSPELERGVRWDDSRFGIAWPLAPQVISERDKGHPDFDPAWHFGQQPAQD